jgi:hypothetical protein
VGGLCGVSGRTVINWIEEEKLPGTHLLYDSRKMGYLVPASSLIEFARRTNPMIVPRIQRAVEAKENELLAVG